MPLIIYVEFTVKAAAVERFRALILENARKSLAHEPGCRRFDVLIDAAAPRRYKWSPCPANPSPGDSFHPGTEYVQRRGYRRPVG